MDNLQPQIYLKDFWGDGERYQMRIPSAINAGTFPDAPLTRESLPTTFADFFIFSYAGQEKGYRFWRTEKQADGSLRLEGYVTPEIGNQLGSRFPPFVQIDLETPAIKPLVHPIDRFFDASAEQMRVIGGEVVEGHQTLVLESVRGEYEQLRKQVGGGTLRIYDVAKAWVDIHRGYIPLRIEWSYRWEFDGKTLPHRYVKQLVGGVQIEKIPNAGFYPVRGSFQTMADDVNWRKDPATPEDIAAGKSDVMAPHAPNEEERWETLKIEAGIPMSSSMFDLEFPDGTIYSDDTKGAAYVAGDPEKYLDQQIRKPDPRRELVSQPLFWAGSLLVLLGLGAMALRSRLKRSKASY